MNGAPSDRPLNTSEVDQAAAALRDAGVSGERTFGGFIAIAGLMMHFVDQAPPESVVTREKLAKYLALLAENYRRVAAELGVTE